MRNRLALAAALAASMPAVGGAVAVQHRNYGPFANWLRRGDKLRKLPERAARRACTLQLRGWKSIPCEAPAGFFWQQDEHGKRKWRLYRLPVGERRVIYDEANDRSIIWSGHGYVKPAYASGRTS